MGFSSEYENHVCERAALGVPPLPLNAEQTRQVCELLRLGGLRESECLGRASGRAPDFELNDENLGKVWEEFEENEKGQIWLIDLLANRVQPGVDDAAKVKAEFLNEIINHNLDIKGLDKFAALKMLGTMLGGYNVIVLVAALSNADEAVARAACNELKNIIFVHDYFNDVLNLSKHNKFALEVLHSWAQAEWFLSREKLPELIRAVVFKVAGETNTDDLSPASEAFTRSDIPLHANAMLSKRQPGSLEMIKELKKSGREVVYVGDVVGTGSSRKSGINSIQWHLGREIEGVPNKKTGGIVIGGVIAPIFFNTAEDSGALPIVADVSALETGDLIDIYPYRGEIVRVGRSGESVVNLSDESGENEGQIYSDKACASTGASAYQNGAQDKIHDETANDSHAQASELVAKFTLSPNTLLDEMRAGGRIPLIIGRGLCAKAREALNLGAEQIFAKPEQPKEDAKGYTLAQKIVGRACGVQGVRAGSYVEPLTLTVGSQDTTGPMTRDEIKELASLGFSCDFVLQSFCHTAAYPKASDAILHKNLPKFINSRGGVSLKPGDGVIHSWLNRMVLPDTVGTGGDSHTRFPIGISFPAGSGLVAFAAVLGAMPLNMPESVLVRFTGQLQEGITLRDLVNAIPYYAIKRGLLSVEKKGKKNVFAGKILEIEGLENLKVEQAFELSDASAERSAAACVVNLDIKPVVEYIRSNVALIEAMINAGYESRATLERRREKMLAWLANPSLLRADKDARYAEVIEINLNGITEPILACPNDPDDVATLGEILRDEKRAKNIDEVFVGSCMTNIGHYRALGEILKGEGQIPTRLWVVPPTKMDKDSLTQDGYYSVFGGAGARIEVPGCSLCMGNQARVRDGAVVFSTSTRNFDNRMGMGAQVYLGSAELAAVCAILGRLPSVDEYMRIVSQKLAGKQEQIYRYLNFNEIENFEIG
ncbi:bifunctional aconitate hydratase 2/2-methylisocitrate dehydratase [Campylobacter curvus]|uniref:bifunctional aconitate hydratase 2/2-methylisocitrate dehydratase n=1 Tax=Campylobacter curvus TaxID=200 RepID=UPI0014701388|nr:bifunctional aconitate hydratase 2/2-methylisocitrate dehydratase [Campylobacter curvus]